MFIPLTTSQNPSNIQILFLMATIVSIYTSISKYNHKKIRKIKEPFYCVFKYNTLSVDMIFGFFK